MFNKSEHDEDNSLQRDFKWIYCPTMQNGEVLFSTYQFKVEEMMSEIYYVKENNSWNLLIECQTGTPQQTFVLYSQSTNPLIDIKKQAERIIISYMMNMKTKLESAIKSMTEICGPF